MPMVRTTMQPSVVLTVSDTEFEALLAQDVVYQDYRDLYVNFFDFEGGCAVDLAAYPSIEIIGPSPSTDPAVAETTSGVAHVGRGAYRYRWREEGQLAPDGGTYTVNWAGVDVEDVAVTATEQVIVP